MGLRMGTGGVESERQGGRYDIGLCMASAEHSVSNRFEVTG